MNLFDKFKQKLGIDTSSFYVIKYTNPLTPGQETQLATRMITHFSPDCRPNSITVGRLSVTVKMTNACLTGEQLKKISDDTVAPERADVNCIELNGNVIWQKPAVHLGW